MPPTKKSKIEHVIDSSGVLEAAKSGNWAKFNKLLTTTSNYLTFKDFNELPPGRNYSVVHQIAFHGNLAALTSLLDRHPMVDVKMSTRDGKTLHEVAIEHDCSTAFMKGLNAAIGRQDLQTLVSLARDGLWPQFNIFFNPLFSSSDISVDQLNTIPPGRTWGVLHQIAYNGNEAALDTVFSKYPTLNLELETSESTPQTPLDISQGRGHSHKSFTVKLRALINAAKKPASSGGASERASSSSSYTFDETEFESVKDYKSKWSTDLEYEAGCIELASKVVEILESNDKHTLVIESPLDDFPQLDKFIEMLREQTEMKAINEEYLKNIGATMWVYVRNDVKFVVTLSDDEDADSRLFVVETDFPKFNEYVETLDIQEEF